MSEEILFEARKSAGDLPLRLADGTVKRFPIRVLDLPTWEKYQTMVEEHIKAARALVRIQSEREKAEKEGREYEPSERDARASNGGVAAVMNQLRLFVDIEAEDLRGFGMSELRKMIEYCVKKSSEDSPNGDGEPPTAEEKKTESAAPTDS